MTELSLPLDFKHQPARSVAALRAWLGLKQQELAEMIRAERVVERVDRRAIMQWEKGRNTPNALNLKALNTIAARELAKTTTNDQQEK